MLLFVWPLGNLWAIMNLQRGDKQPNAESSDEVHHWTYELTVRYLRLFAYLSVTLVVYHFSFPTVAQFAEVTVLSRWTAIMLLRNLVICWVFLWRLALCYVYEPLGERSAA